MGDVEGQVGVLLDQQHGETVLLVEPLDELEQLLGDQWGETEARLVAQQQLRPAHQRPGDGQHLLLAARQRARLLGTPIGEPRERLVPQGEIHVDLAVATHVGAGAQVVLDREIGERAAALGHLGDAEAHDRIGRALDDALPHELDRTLARDHARHGAHRRGLAGTVGAEDHRHLALLHLEIDLVQHLDRAVPGREARDP